MDFELKLHKGQRRVLNNLLKSKAKINTIVASRQAGKSHLLSKLILILGMEKASQEILVVTPVVKQGDKIFETVIGDGDKMGVITKINRTKNTIELINGTIIYWRSADRFDNIRGMSTDVIIADEFAMMKPEAWESAISPCMAAKKGSRAFLFSTPRGKNLFYEFVMLGKDEREKNYSYNQMHYSENPLYDLEKIEVDKKKMPEALFNQEYNLGFTSAAAVFKYKNSAILESYSEPMKGIKYYAGLDLARKSDETVLTIMSEDGEVVCIYAIKLVKWSQIVDDVVNLLKKYNNAQCLIEVNSIGDVIYELIEEKYHYITPIFTQNANKQEFIEDLIFSFNEIEIFIPVQKLSPELHHQLDVFTMQYSEKTRKTVYCALPGHHDDYVISLCLSNKIRKDNSINYENSGFGFYMGDKKV